MPFDMKELMKDPGMIAAMNMMAQSGFQPGANVGSRFGRAGLGTMSTLQDIENASAQSSYRQKQMQLAEERNRLAQEMTQRQHELSQKSYDEKVRANRAQEEMYQEQPVPMEGGGWWTPARGVQGASVDPMKQMLATMMGARGDSDLPGQQSSAYTPAPQGAIDMLKLDSSLGPAFKAKYGYIPR